MNKTWSPVLALTDASTVLEIAGAGLITLGAGMAWLPLGFIVAGVACFAASFMVEMARHLGAAQDREHKAPAAPAAAGLDEDWSAAPLVRDGGQPADIAFDERQRG